MSGLDSIAMAVAHLEEQASQPKREDKTASADSQSPPPKLPMPQPISSDKATRVVSSSSIASIDGAGTSVKEGAAAANSENNCFAKVLADPASWLHSTEKFSVPPPPKDAIEKVLQDDVLCGRGGETNHHQGNIQYRNLVKAYQPLYIESKRRDKPRIAQCIVYTIRKQGGRFLKRTDPRSNTWVDVGNIKAREKTSQALREGAPELRGGNEPKPVTAGSASSPTTCGATSPVNCVPPVPAAANFAAPLVQQHHAPQHFFRQFALSPLQQAMGRQFLATTPPTAATQLTPSMISPLPSRFLEITAMNQANQRKRPSLVSDGDSSESSQDSAANNSGIAPSLTSNTTSTPRGPRLKRLKLRMES